MYGTQTKYSKGKHNRRFENDVKMYGTQTHQTPFPYLVTFENDVKMYGTQTYDRTDRTKIRLRMM